MPTLQDRIGVLNETITKALEDKRVTPIEIVHAVDAVGSLVTAFTGMVLGGESDDAIAAEAVALYGYIISKKTFDIPGVPAMLETWLLSQVGQMIRPAVIALLAKIREV